MADILANHLWQSTLFAAAVALATLAFRRHGAHVRYWLWLAASLKFLVPFALLVAIGNQVESRLTSPRATELPLIVGTMTQPFTPQLPVETMPRGWRGPVDPPVRTVTIRALTMIWICGVTTILLTWGVRWRRIAVSLREGVPITSGREWNALQQLAQGVRPIRLVSVSAPIEPGVFGIRTPMLIWPDTIGDRLPEPHVRMILAHEVAHVRRHDNLAAAAHMLVEAVFWFHPLVWWLGARLIDERERACDEEVVRRGHDPHIYAESILKTCQCYVESPLVCVAGVTGSNLKKRIEQIMTNDSNLALGVLKKVCLSIGLTTAVALPVAIGVLTSPRLAAQIVAPAPDAPTFEVASVKPNKDGGPMGGRGGPGRFTAHKLPVRRLIRQAYDIHDSQIIGGPDWLNAQGYDVDATTGEKPRGQNRFMMQTLLRDRFKLMFHTEMRELNVYALIVARSDGRLGPGLKRIPDNECPPPGSPRQGGPPPGPGPSPFDPNAVAPCGAIIFGPGRLLAHGVPISMLARSLGGLPAITSFNRVVTDMTKLEGVYDFDFKWTNEFGRGGPPAGPGAAPAAPAPGDEPSLFTALQEQLGLKLNAQRATLDVLVIDSIEKPTEN